MLMQTRRPVTVAIVEDNLVIRSVYASMLQSLHYYLIAEATNGKEFLDELETAVLLPDVCLLDVQMPKMNGFETTVLLKKKFPEIKVLAYSMHCAQKDITRILECGADGFIEKGTDAKALGKAIETLIPWQSSTA
jgi:DNA-binding NarL/FixJ family response regulator